MLSRVGLDGPGGGAVSCRPLILFPLLVACSGPEGVLVVDPPAIDWGEVDFLQNPSVPMYGFDPVEVDLVNEGEVDLNIRILGYDHERLCLEGYDHEEGVIELPTLSPGSRAVLKIGVCGYLTDGTSSELGSLVEGRIHLMNDGADPVEMLEYSFIPVRDQGGDTGN
jgi:hypothetical protein